MKHFPSINEFLGCPTPQGWLNAALSHQDLLLIDHANCEKKAAATALHLMHCYLHHHDLLQKMARLAREELLHFQKVTRLLKVRQITYLPLRPGRYARVLRQQVRTHEPARLIDFLIIGALIEARSCERFQALVPHLDPVLAKFYQSLHEAEQRHFQDYLQFAEQVSPEPIDERIQFLRDVEADLITSKDPAFRFHSGVPSS